MINIVVCHFQFPGGILHFGGKKANFANFKVFCLTQKGHHKMSGRASVKKFPECILKLTANIGAPSHRKGKQTGKVDPRAQFKWNYRIKQGRESVIVGGFRLISFLPRKSCIHHRRSGCWPKFKLNLITSCHCISRAL